MSKEIENKWKKARNILILLNLTLLSMLLFFYVHQYLKRSINVVLGALFPFILSFIIVYCLMPFIEVLHEKFKINRKLAIMLVLSLFFLVVFYVIFTIAPLIINQFNGFINYIIQNKDVLKNELLTSSFFKNIDTEAIISKLNNILFEQMLNIFNSSIAILTGTFSLFFMTPIFTIMLMFSYDKIKKSFEQFLVHINRKNWVPLAKDIDHALAKYVKVTLLDCCIIGGLSFLFFSILKLDYIQLFSLIIGLGNMIPFIGPFVTLIPVLFYVLVKSPHLFFVILIVVTILQGIEANIIKPWLTSKSIDIHPITTLLLVLVFGALFGIIGAFISIPSYIIIKLSVVFFLKNRNMKV